MESILICCWLVIVGRDNQCLFTSIQPYKISILVSLVIVSVLFFFLEYSLATMVLIFLVVFTVLSAILLVVREFFLVRSSSLGELDQYLDSFHAWLQAVGSLVGVSRVSVIYLVGENTQIKLVQLGSSTRPILSSEIVSLYHRMAWSIPVAAIRSSDGVVVVLPWCVLKILLLSIKRSREGVYLRLEDTTTLRLSYYIVKNMIKSFYNVSNRLLAYLAVKVYTRAILDGIIRPSYTILADLDKLLPPEDIITRYVVVRQLNEEKKLLLTSNSGSRGL